VVDAWQLKTWEDYRDVKRLGRKTRLAETQRKLLWGLFESVREKLSAQSLLTQADVFAKITDAIQSDGKNPFDFAVVDEAQDIGVPELRFLAALGGDRPNSLFFAGDLGQRIFRQPFSWKALGVDIRGRSATLRVNYRTSHQIRRQADRLLPPEISDVDGNADSRKGTVSVFNGPDPSIQVASSQSEETKIISEWIQSLINDGFRPEEIGVFVRSDAQLARAEEAVQAAGLKSVQNSSTIYEARNPKRISHIYLVGYIPFLLWGRVGRMHLTVSLPLTGTHPSDCRALFSSTFFEGGGLWIESFLPETKK